MKNRVGEENYNNQGLLMKVITYRGTNDMDVEFDDGYIAKKVTYQNFKKGNILNHNIKKHRKEYNLGEIKENFQGCKMQLVEYRNWKEVYVQFLDEHFCRVKTMYKTYEKGTVKNPYAPSVYGVGIVGNKHKIPSKEYYAWSDMLRRCYDQKTKEKQLSYKDITCCDEWLYYENFHDWLHSQENFDKWLKGDKWHVDKDILVKGNKIYSPETCCLVSNQINCLFERNKSTRGKYPIGVSYHKATNKYIAACKNGNGESIYLGVYDDYNDAFVVYKKEKEKTIKQIAQKEFNKGNIIKQCYEAIMKYQVEITD